MKRIEIKWNKTKNIKKRKMVKRVKRKKVESI